LHLDDTLVSDEGLPHLIGELLFGFLGGGAEARNRNLLREFVGSPRVGALAIDEETAERYAAIRDHLREQGKPVCLSSPRSRDRKPSTRP
jgi:predicted nucleic acid-binding protein